MLHKELRREHLGDPKQERQVSIGGGTMVAVKMRKNVSLSLPGELVDEIDTWAAEDRVNRSSLVARLIQAEKQRRFDAELDQAYRNYATESFGDDVDFFFPAQAESVLGDPA